MEDKVKKIVSDMLGSFSNMTVPQHKHNGVDSPVIPIQNIGIVAGVGVPFTNGVYQYNFFIDKFDNSLELIPNDAVREQGNADFNIGEVGSPFNNVNIATDTGFQVSVVEASPGLSSNVLLMSSSITNDAVSDGVDSVTEQLFTTGKLFTASGDFAIQLPNASRPSPVAGMIAFEAGTFYKCEVTGTWIPL